jgi:predicted nucleic acid-binding protein
VIVLDASILIAYLDGTDARHCAAQALLIEAVDDALGAGTLTLAEILVGPVRAGRLNEARAALGDLEIEELVLGEGAAERLAMVRVETGLKLPDCHVLLTATEAGAELATFDERLGSVARTLGLTVRGC